MRRPLWGMANVILQILDISFKVTFYVLRSDIIHHFPTSSSKTPKKFEENPEFTMQNEI